MGRFGDGAFFDHGKICLLIDGWGSDTAVYTMPDGIVRLPVAICAVNSDQ